MSELEHPIIVARAARNLRQSGTLLIGLVLLEVLAMHHHPTVHAPDVANAIAGIHRFAGLSAAVHAVLIGALVAVTACLHAFATLRGMVQCLIVRLGWMSYVSGVSMMIGAALTSGFLVPGLAEWLPHETPADQQIVAAMLMLSRVLNQSCANAATFAMSIGVTIWSFGLLRERGRLRALGLLGLATSLPPMLALLMGWLHLDVRGMSAVLLLQSIWNLAVGFWLRQAGTPSVAGSTPSVAPSRGEFKE